MTKQFDSGSEITIISPETWRKLSQPALQPSDITAITLSGDKIQLRGKFICQISYQNRKASIEMHVGEYPKDLIGTDFLRALGLEIVLQLRIDHSTQGNDFVEEGKRYSAPITLSHVVVPSAYRKAHGANSRALKPFNSALTRRSSRSRAGQLSSNQSCRNPKP